MILMVSGCTITVVRAISVAWAASATFGWVSPKHSCSLGNSTGIAKPVWHSECSVVRTQRNTATCRCKTVERQRGKRSDEASRGPKSGAFAYLNRRTVRHDTEGLERALLYAVVAIVKTLGDGRHHQSDGVREHAPQGEVHSTLQQNTTPTQWSRTKIASIHRSSVHDMIVC